MRQPVFTACCCLAALLAATSGCASGSNADRVPPARRALEASHRTVQRSVEDAFETSDNRPPYTLPARYNPPRCDAPTFEVLAHGRWTRVYVKAADEVQKQLEALAPEDEVMAGGGEAVRFKGRWRGKREAETGLAYPVFQVREIIE